MGIDYDFRLVCGYTFKRNDVESIFERTKKDPGEFRMEDRFDNKTGQKIEPVQVWIRKPSTESWFEVDGERYAYFEDGMSDHLEEKFGCEILEDGSFPSSELTITFNVNDPRLRQPPERLGRITVRNQAIPLRVLSDMTKRALELKDKLLAAGLKVGEPEIYISTRIS